MYLVDNNRLFPATDHSRQIAKNLYEEIKDLPIISPHGHCDPFWFSENTNFPDAAQLFVIPDHYILRMLVSQGISFNELALNTIVKINLKQIQDLFGKSSVKIIICLEVHPRLFG